MAEPALATGPAPDRRNLEQWLGEVERAATQQKSGDKRGIDALRAEVQRTLVTSDGDVISNAGGIWRALLKPSRLALLALALVAGGVAAYFATQGQVPVPAPQTVVVEVPAAPPPAPVAPLHQILVARQAIGLGERLSAATVEWKPWPTEALRDDYIAEEKQPQAAEEMVGAIARYEFFPGEPIRLAKLATAGDGYLSAVLQAGEVGVSIPVGSETASGGFIQPNDHVDVLVTKAVGERQVAETLLRNVRVLAIEHRLGDVANPSGDEQGGEASEEGAESADGKTPATFSGGVTATLALNSAQAEIVTSARGGGTLSLVLRSISDFAAPAAASEEATTNQRIRLTSPFWAR